MGVLELTLLTLTTPTHPTSPTLLHNLRQIRTALKTNSRFFFLSSPASSSQPDQLFILGLWPTLQSHHDFLASPERDEILAPQEGQTEFQWGRHFDNVSSMDSLPLPSTGQEDLVICRWLVPSESETMDDGLFDIADGVPNVFLRKCLDPAQEGMVEWFLIYVDRGDARGKGVRGKIEEMLPEMERWTLRDLEKVD
jgi:hypothetical protein